MTNRTERRRQQRIAVSDITYGRCGWKGCQATVLLPEHAQALPTGWRLLVISERPLDTPEGLSGADHDKFICPKHVMELDGLLEGPYIVRN